MATSYDNVQLSVPGTQNGTGTDTPSTIDLAADLGTLPAGAAYVMLYLANGSSSSRWLGCRPTGKSSYIFLEDLGSRRFVPQICPIGTNGQIDIYAEGSTSEVYVAGILTSDEFYMNDADSGQTIETIPLIGGGGWGYHTLTAVPSGSSAVLVRGGASGIGNPVGPVGGDTDWALSFGRIAIAPIDGSDRIYYRSYSDFSVIGYFKEDVYVNDYGNSVTDQTVSDTWETVTQTDSQAQIAVLRVGNSSSSSIAYTRPVGGSFAEPYNHSWSSTGKQHIWAPLSGSGSFQVWTESVSSNTYWIDGWIRTPSVATSTITLTLKDLSGSTARASLTNLQWAWFPGAFPTATDTPTSAGTAETTDASGVLAVTVDSAPSTQGWLVLYSGANNWQASYKVTTA